MKKLFSVMLVVFFVSSGMVYAQGFTNDSVNGQYGAQVVYGDEEGAGVGVVNGSGNGTVTGNFTINVPGIGYNRTVITATVAGDYTISGEPTFPLNWTVTFENGRSLDQSADCVIMQANDNKLATEVVCVARSPLTPLRGFLRGGSMVMTFKRLPD
jgi:hypothetical protein